MLRYILTINLLSDMCCGSGVGNGSSQDIISSYDDFGLPIIYGRRLKGLLRDNAEFMANFGYIEKTLVDRVFGTVSSPGIIRVGNAQIADAEEIKSELSDISKDISLNKIINSGNIEEVFTVTRTATAINDEGVADDQQLRSFGVVPKGVKFYSEIEIDVNTVNCDEYRLLEDVCKSLRGIGLNRNRGLGRVECFLQATKVKAYENAEIEIGSTEIEYIIETRDSVVSTGNYISGSSLQGYFINQLLNKKLIGENEVQDYLSKVIFSNAYICKNGKKYLPMPIGMFNIKNDKDSFYSIIDGYKMDDGKQYVKAKGYYCILDDRIYTADIKNKTEFHFSKKTKDLYKISAIDGGQTFTGRIYSDNTEFLKKILKVINNNKGIIHLGGSVNAQYAQSSITIIKQDDTPKDNDNNKNNKDNYNNKNDGIKAKDGRLIVEFLSDTVFMNSIGVNAVDEESIKYNLCKILGEEFSIEEIYTETVKVGGYNSKWKAPKRRYLALKKGTQILVKIDNLQEIKEQGFIGFLNSEGYGEYKVRDLLKCNEFDWEEDGQDAVKGARIDKAKDIISKVCKNLAERICQIRVVNNFDNETNLSASTVMRLIPAFKASDMDEQRGFMDAFTSYVTKNYNGENNKGIRDYSNKIIEEFNKIDSRIANKYVKAEFNNNKNEMFRTFLQAYITQAKLYYKEKR